MTSPTARIDKDLGKWRYGGRLKKVNYGISPEPDPDHGGGGILVEKYKAKVVVTSGSTVNMRKTSNANSDILVRIPNGTIIPIFDDSKELYQTQYKNVVGYVSSKFLQKVDDGGSKEVGIFIPVSGELRDSILKALQNARLQG